MVEYPGYVSRQSLVDFCQKEVDELAKENVKLMNAEDVSGLSAIDMASLAAKLANNHHKQLAFRAICEWARENQAKNIGPYPDVGGGGVMDNPKRMGGQIFMGDTGITNPHCGIPGCLLGYGHGHGGAGGSAGAAGMAGHSI